MKAVIMAGGKGRRLRPFTYIKPKPLLPVGSINPIEYLIRDIKNSGFDEIQFWNSTDVIILAFGYGFQLYFDFAGYSHIAIGSALLVGIPQVGQA